MCSRSIESTLGAEFDGRVLAPIFLNTVVSESEMFRLSKEDSFSILRPVVLKNERTQVGE